MESGDCSFCWWEKIILVLVFAAILYLSFLGWQLFHGLLHTEPPALEIASEITPEPTPVPEVWLDPIVAPQEVHIKPHPGVTWRFTEKCICYGEDGDE